MAATNIQSFSGDVEVSSNLTVDTNTLHVDSVAGRVGIGKTDPAYTVDVNGILNTTSLYLGGSEFTGGGFDETADPIAIGTDAGATAQGSRGVAMGTNAGQTSQGVNAVAMGFNTGNNRQGSNATAVGYGAGQTSQGNNAVAVGLNAGQTAQGGNATAVGYAAGQTSQDANTVAIGQAAGQSNQLNQAIAVGYIAGQHNQRAFAVAVAPNAGRYNQGASAVAVGVSAGRTFQRSSAVAVGQEAGHYFQGNYAVAIGYRTGMSYQGKNVGYATAIGFSAGKCSQGIAATAIGISTGEFFQGHDSIAIGQIAGSMSQGSYAIALGYAAGQYNQANGSFYVSTNSVRNSSGSYYMRYNTSTGEVSYTTSDDRVKDGETLITGAVKTLSKLRPQNYFKRMKLDPYAPEQNWSTESGLMAQEVYYSAPELRHIVGVPDDAGHIENYTPPPSDDPAQDPDYSMWGTGIATVDYMQMVPYLVKGVQEIVTELPRSKTTVSNAWGQNIMGLVVSANENAHKTNTTPIVALSNVYMDKKWYGVVSDKTTDTNDYDTLVDTKGDTLIWVTDVGGPLESGDLVTTSNVAPGYAQKQGDDLIRSSTVAKVTQDCDFTEPTQRPIRVPKRELSNVTYYRHDASYEINLKKYEDVPSFKTRVDETTIYFKEVTRDSNIYTDTRYYEGDTEVSEYKYNTLSEDSRSIKHLSEISVDDYEALDDEAKASYTLGIKKRYFMLNYSKSKTKIPQHDEEIVVQEMVDVLDENGQIVWEETANTVPEYILVDHGSYKAALVSAKLI